MEKSVIRDMRPGGPPFSPISQEPCAPDTGVINDKHICYSFGEIKPKVRASGQDYKYTGKPLDEEAGLDLHYYGARYYDGFTGRFTSIDPLASKYPSWGPYIYVLNNPIRLTDPTGMAADDGGGTVSDREIWEKTRNSDPVAGNATQMTETHQTAQANATQTQVKAAKTINSAASDVGDAAVATAEQLETPATVVAGGLAVAAAVTASPALATAAAVVGGVALTATLIKTANDPTTENLVNAGVQTALTVGTAGTGNVVKPLVNAGRMTSAQARVTHANLAVLAISGSLAASQMSKSRNNTSKIGIDGIPGVIQKQH